MTDKQIPLDFDALISIIQQVNGYLTAQVGKAINIGLTLRNWTIGFYIREYEQNGSDRAEYGTALLEVLSSHLCKLGLKGMSARSLRLYRQFYLTYPQIWQALSAKSSSDLLAGSIWQSLSAESGFNRMPVLRKLETSELVLPSQQLFDRLSFSHFSELLSLDDEYKRAFYEIECIRGNWSVRELKRQIGSLLYERSGLSKNKKKLIGMAQTGVEKGELSLAIRDPYIFEFLGIHSREVMGESELENALLDKLQDFLLELGHGFCFEARQKRILIGDTHCFVDLVFYHRILKCHILVELKVASFSHEHLGQLNTYISWYSANEMTDGDNRPI